MDLSGAIVSAVALTSQDKPNRMNITSAHRPSGNARCHYLGTLLAVIVLACTPSAKAQTRTTGEITGRVSNKALGVFLEGARVELVGANRTALTDREGFFRLADIPAGPATLAVSYTGLNAQRVNVDVRPGQTQGTDIELVSEVYVMDKFTVASLREGQAAAITQQRNAPNVKNVAAADAFGNIADGNAAEALRLLPGISAINDENESRFMMVRGMDANLNNVTFDGMKLASGGSGAARQTGMSEIPLGAIEIMEVTKSPTPDMDGDSIGGNINLRPASIFDRVEPRRITYAVSASMRVVSPNTSSTAYSKSRVRPTYSFGYSDVFGKNRNLGVALNLSHTINWVPQGGIVQATWEQTNASPAYMRVYNHFDYHSTERERTGVNIRLDYKLSQNSTFYLNSFYTYYHSKQLFEGGSNNVTGLAQVVTFDASGNPIPAQTQFPLGNPSYRAGGFNAAGTRVPASILPGYTNDLTEMVNATYQFGGGASFAMTKRYSFQPGGRYRRGNLDIDYAGIYQESPSWSGQKDLRRDLIRAYNIQVLNTAWRLDSRETGFPTRRDVTQTGGPDVRNPANWTLGGLTGQVVEQGDNIYGGQLNAKYNFSSPVPSYLKTGVKFMSEERYTSNPSRTYTYTGPQGAFLSSLINTRINPVIPAGEWHPFGAVPTYLDVSKINALRDQHPEYFTVNEATALTTALQNDKTATEEVLAGYAMGNMSLGALSVLGGLRVEKTFLSGESAVQDPRAGLTLTDPVARVQAQWGRKTSVERDYMNVLPGIHFKYEPGPNWVMRASYSASFGRPSFGSIYPDTRINYDTERITQNNPGLKPQDADNFDVSIERYFEPVGIISVGVFLKEIKNFLFSTVVIIPNGNDNGFNGDYAGWDLATQANGGFARVRGVELNYSQQLSFLPGVWRGLGIFANYTYLETNGNYGRINEPAGSELVNFTPKVASAGLSYSYGPFAARINGNYTGQFLRAYNVNPLLRSYRNARTMVDAKMSYRYSRALTLFADASNIFNSKQRFFSGNNPDRLADDRDCGVRLQAGVSGSF